MTIPDWVAIVILAAAYFTGDQVGLRRGRRVQLAEDAAAIVKANEDAAATIRESTQRYRDAGALAQNAQVLVDHDPIPLRRGRVVLVGTEHGLAPFHVLIATISRSPDGDQLRVHALDPVSWANQQLLDELD